MNIEVALRAFAALANETRLWVLCLLIEAGRDGLSAGDLADALMTRQNTLSSHLKQMRAAGLVASRRDGRRLVYRADATAIRELVGFLTADCCEGAPALSIVLAASRELPGRGTAAGADQDFRLDA